MSIKLEKFRKQKIHFKLQNFSCVIQDSVLIFVFLVYKIKDLMKTF